MQPTIPPTHPTMSPTLAPTLTPTIAPTNAPTSEPTNAPTLVPTSAPTKNPTYSPTPKPTLKPTSKPSINPTYGWTDAPTTAWPSSSPTTPPEIENDDTYSLEEILMEVVFILVGCGGFGVIMFIAGIIQCWVIKKENKMKNSKRHPLHMSEDDVKKMEHGVHASMMHEKQGPDTPDTVESEVIDRVINNNLVHLIPRTKSDVGFSSVEMDDMNHLPHPTNLNEDISTSALDLGKTKMNRTATLDVPDLDNLVERTTDDIDGEMEINLAQFAQTSVQWQENDDLGVLLGDKEDMNRLTSNISNA
mmetsp:Transcript_63882/g.57481  ORF Transcript_63882/g.57481 Transcript_63882/m.57481 type:complete len:304 (-) Transcript_63882:62-973(-)